MIYSIHFICFVSETDIFPTCFFSLSHSRFFYSYIQKVPPENLTLFDSTESDNSIRFDTFDTLLQQIDFSIVLTQHFLISSLFPAIQFSVGPVSFLVQSEIFIFSLSSFHTVFSSHTLTLVLLSFRLNLLCSSGHGYVPLCLLFPLQLLSVF